MPMETIKIVINGDADDAVAALRAATTAAQDAVGHDKVHRSWVDGLPNPAPGTIKLSQAQEDIAADLAAIGRSYGESLRRAVAVLARASGATR